MNQDIHQLVERLRLLSRADDPELLRDELAEMHSEDLSDAFQRMQVDEMVVVMRQLDSALAADVLVELPTETARQLFREIPDSTLAHYLDVLPMDDAADFREELGEERFDALLELIPREDAREIRRLLAYPEDSVGRLMTERFFEVSPESTMADILADIRRSSPEKYEMVNDIYVLNEDRHLVGIFSLRTAIRAEPTNTARELMNDEFISGEANEPAEDVARRMSRYGLYALPILDERGRMLGLFTGDDAQAILRDADTEDVLKLGAVTGTPEDYLSLSPRRLALRRLPWLMGLFVAETLTGSVMRHYGQNGGDDNALQLNPIVYFIPLLIGAGGNTGSQTTTTITRALAVGEITPSDWLAVMRREMGTALIIGLVLGTAGLLRAVAWGTDIRLSLAVGLALPCIVLWAASVGSLLPLAARRIGVDPAVMSAPFIATLVDATGLIIYFEIAKLFLDGRLAL